MLQLFDVEFSEHDGQLQLEPPEMPYDTVVVLQVAEDIPLTFIVFVLFVSSPSATTVKFPSASEPSQFVFICIGIEKLKEENFVFTLKFVVSLNLFPPLSFTKISIEVFDVFPR